MNGSIAPTLPVQAPAASNRLSWAPLLGTLAVVGGYALFFVLPYLANGLYRFPLEEVAVGYHDPKDLWPYDTSAGGLASLGFFAYLGGFLTMMLGPLVALTAGTWAGWQLWTERTTLDRAARTRLVSAVVVAAGVLALLASPFGEALMSWFLD